jgi:hypothetical protein
MEVIAEGVETHEQLETLRRLGCPRFQGFIVSPPIPCEQFEQQLFAGLLRIPSRYENGQIEIESNPFENEFGALIGSEKWGPN